ncbi:MAG: DMT family transporter [Chloroflexi bacterium]|nr:DMT family transporter [Chloroflexota bacterium]MCI0778800.1 DMT family transporter [Chloroflexota bacterium]MCI0816236.1 DMT family transporter [Chloroflexota bacterium]
MEIGILLAIAAAFGWGAGDVFVRRAMFGARPEAVTVVVAGMVLSILAVLVVVTGGFAVPEASFLVATAVMGLLTWLTGNLLYFHGMQRAGVVVVAPILGMIPIFSIALAVTLGGERPSVATLAGALAIVTGVAVVLTDRRRVLR